MYFLYRLLFIVSETELYIIDFVDHMHFAVFFYYPV